ncbi:hypothetical protein AVEN_116539-1, partial [Araneus ventricosus]
SIKNEVLHSLLLRHVCCLVPQLRPIGRRQFHGVRPPPQERKQHHGNPGRRSGRQAPPGNEPPPWTLTFALN